VDVAIFEHEGVAVVDLATTPERGSAFSSPGLETMGFAPCHGAISTTSIAAEQARRQSGSRTARARRGGNIEPGGAVLLRARPRRGALANVGGPLA